LKREATQGFSFFNQQGEIMAWDAVRVPITLGGNREMVVGYAMLDMDFMKKVEPFPQMWGISFSYTEETGVVRSIDFFVHEVSEDRSIEAAAVLMGDNKAIGEVSLGKTCTKIRVHADNGLEVVDISAVPDDHVFGLEQTEEGEFLHLEGKFTQVYETEGKG
jgi:hypothetical protein